VITIDRDIPIPSNYQVGQPAKYPFRAMEIGDSFFVAGKKTGMISGSIQGHRKRYGGRFVTRTVVEDGVMGVRVWRAA
jgi:hypothetical protein